MAIEDEKLAQWTFEGKEVSAGVFRISGRDRAGRTVERIGTDEEVLLQECMADAIELSSRAPHSGA
jgi:hypothetical protein